MSDLKKCAHCGLPTEQGVEETFCSRECQILFHLGKTRDAELLLAIRRLAEYERQAAAAYAAKVMAIPAWVARKQWFYPDGSGESRACGNCSHADCWSERGQGNMDCGLHGKAKTEQENAVFAWRDRFIDWGMCDDGDALYCNLFAATAGRDQ
jgi:hypothetical protein